MQGPLATQRTHQAVQLAELVVPPRLSQSKLRGCAETSEHNT